MIAGASTGRDGASALLEVVASGVVVGLGPAGDVAAGTRSVDAGTEDGVPARSSSSLRQAATQSSPVSKRRMGPPGLNLSSTASPLE
jgi:hypothetical protein